MDTDINQRLTWIENGGKRIWSSDWSNLEGRELTDYILSSRAEVQKEIDAGVRDLLFLINATNAISYADTLKALTQNTKIVGPYTKGSAVVGLDAMKKSLLRFVNAIMSPTNTKAFDKQEEALQWLISLQTVQGVGRVRQTFVTVALHCRVSM